MKVVVIGAGLGGLCAGRGLRQAGAEVAVYERDDAASSRFQGWRIGLTAETLDIVRWCLPARLHPLLAAVEGEEKREGRAVDPQLIVLGIAPADHEGRLHDRDVLRHLLLDGVPVRFGAKLDRYEVLPDGRVRAHFADGRTDTADLLVAADGMGSTVRRQLLPDVHEVDLGIRGVIGRTMLTDRFRGLVPGWSTMVVDDGFTLLLGKMAFRRVPREAAAALAPDVELPDTRSYVRWLTLLRPEHPLVAENDPEAAVALLVEIIADWHPDLRALVGAADRENTGVGALRNTTEVGAWPVGPVVLLGDAVHPMPPGGLGANLAFRDARLLVALVTGGGALPDALAEYQRQVLAYGAQARDQALAQLGTFV
jgi:2-polyprenyl-6-methoxyphenol hydroxylase-like FAD-dependent oxidoreductase